MKLDFSKIIIQPKSKKFFKPGKGNNYFLLVNRKQSFISCTCYPLGTSENNLYQKIFGFPSKHKPFYAYDAGVYFDRNALKYELVQCLKMEKKSPGWLKKVTGECEKFGGKILRKSLEFKLKNWRKSKDEELKISAQNFYEMLTEMAAYLLPPNSLAPYLEKQLRKKLVKLKKIKNYTKNIFPC